ncbi:type IV secretion system DNA-binding domain-containing protein [Legionella pneumophila]|nr:type IV secretion system DNA-binding domain-containing protein [Legionella pneumophila]
MQKSENLVVAFLLGMQSFSQLTKVYGQSGGAKELFDLLNTRFFFRSPSADMARLVAASWRRN